MYQGGTKPGKAGRIKTRAAAQFWNFLCTGDLAFRLQYLFAIIDISGRRPGVSSGRVSSGHRAVQAEGLRVDTPNFFSNDFYFSFKS